MIQKIVIELNENNIMGYKDFDDKLKKTINILVGILVLIAFCYVFIFFLKIALYIFAIGAIISLLALVFKGGNGNGPPWLNK